jgi:hypothetical protein
MRFSGAGAVVGMVRVEVVDASARPPRQRHAEGDDTNGRGLELVDGLADRWGWRHEGGGKSIWCELDRGRSLLRGAAVTGLSADLGVELGAYEPQCAVTNRA